MELLNKNKSLHIDKEAVATLAMAKLGLLKPVQRLMNKKEAKEVDKSGFYKGEVFPFSFILAPSGKENYEVLKNAKKGETLDFVCCNNIIGNIKVEEIFEIDPFKRVGQIYKTRDYSHPGVKSTLERLGELAISGEYEIKFDDVEAGIKKIKERIKTLGAKKITGIVMAARPLHRAHEKVIRQSLEESDLLIVFLTKPYMDDFLNYEIRKKALKYFVKNYLPKEKVLIIPLENTYIFAGSNEILLNAIVLKNFGCTKFIIGQTHAGLGMYYDKYKSQTILNELKDINIKIQMINELVYCDECKTLVSTNTCPHGSHHHIHYHAESILELFKAGLLPPAVLVRKEISAMILAHLYPNRFKKISKLYHDFIPSNGLIEDVDEEKFYQALMKIYQTSSLT